MSKLKSLAGETALYGLGTIIPRLFNFFLVPLHTGIFHAEDFGVITYLYAFVGFLNIVFTFGMETAFFRFATKTNDIKKIFNIAQTCVLILTLTLSGSFILFADPIAESLNIPNHSEYIVWLALILAFDAIVALPFARLRLEKKPIPFAIAKIANVLLLIALNVYFLKINYNPSIGIGYIIIANLIANAFYLLFFAKSLINWRPAYDKEIFSSMFHYAYPVMLSGLAGMTNEMFSRILLLEWLPENFYAGKTSSYAVGVFGACYKYAAIMNLGIQAFRFASEPFFFSNAADKNSPALFAKVNYYFVIVGCIVLLGVSINMDILKHYLQSDEYWEGLDIVPILLTGYLFLGMYFNFSVWFKITDKTYFGTFITVIGAIITIVGNYLLIPIAGYLGSSIITLVTYGSMAVICYGLGQKHFPVPYSIGKSLAYIGVTLLITYAVRDLVFSSQWVATFTHTLIMVIFIGGIYLLERKNLKLSS